MTKVLAPVAGAAQTPMTFEEYDPKSTLVVPEHPRTKAKYPFIDVHNHQRRDISAEDVTKLVADMDRIGLAVMVVMGAVVSRVIAKPRTVSAAPPRPLRNASKRSS